MSENMTAIRDLRPRHPGEVIEQLIVAHKDLEEARETLVERQLRYDRLVRDDMEAARETLADHQMRYDRLARELGRLARPGESRQIYHDVYLPGVGYIAYLVEIWPNGQVHLSPVERGHQVIWSQPSGPEVHPEPPVFQGAHAATSFPEGHEGELPELTDEMVRQALKPEEGDAELLTTRYRAHITAGPGRDV